MVERGMYGMNVHKAVKANNESETGITIHFVNEHYDEGAIIFQAKTALDAHRYSRRYRRKDS